MGSVFSPYYAWARARGEADPMAYCSLNVALYGGGRRRWSMTERAERHIQREASCFTIGPSAVAWDGQALDVRIDEIGVPIPARIVGRVRIEPTALFETTYPLDREGRHTWHPIAPRARFEVAMQKPALRWSGWGYHDSNWGDEALEDRFDRWTWSRSSLAGSASRTALLYDVLDPAPERRSIALCFDERGRVEPFEAPPAAALPTSRIWRIPRATRCEPGASPKVLETLEDTPFYSRSVVSTRLLGDDAVGIHESLSLTRFRAPWVKLLLPFRMPRRR